MEEIVAFPARGQVFSPCCGFCGLPRGVVVAARRGEVSLAGCSGGRRLCAAPRGVVVAARRGEVSLASCRGGCFLRFAPRGVLRCRVACGALRPLFLLRSRAADQEKRPEKKSRAVMACASVRLERLGGTCIRSAPRCISRGQREEGIFCLRGKEIWELGLWKLCCTVGLCRFVAPKAASFAPRRAGCCVGAGPAGRCGRFSCFAHAPLIKKSGQKRNHGLLWPALPSGSST